MLKKNHSFTIKLSKQTRVLFYKRFIIIKGTKGKIKTLLFLNNNEYYFKLTKASLNLYQKTLLHKNVLQIYNAILHIILGVNFLFSKKILFMGVGFRIWLKEIKNKSKILVLKVGFSQDIYIQIPKYIIVFSLRPTLLLIRGLNKYNVYQFCSFIRSHKKPDKYKGKGIQYQNESILLKPGKKN